MIRCPILVMHKDNPTSSNLSSLSLMIVSDAIRESWIVALWSGIYPIHTLHKSKSKIQKYTRNNMRPLYFSMLLTSWWKLMETKSERFFFYFCFCISLFIAICGVPVLKLCCKISDENNLSNLGYSDCWKTFTFSEVTFALIYGLELIGCEIIFNQIFQPIWSLFLMHQILQSISDQAFSLVKHRSVRNSIVEFGI